MSGIVFIFISHWIEASVQILIHPTFHKSNSIVATANCIPQQILLPTPKWANLRIMSSEQSLWYEFFMQAPRFQIHPYHSCFADYSSFCGNQCPRRFVEEAAMDLKDAVLPVLSLRTQGLTSLHTLFIEGCLDLKSFPEDLEPLLPYLKKMRICECPIWRGGYASLEEIITTVSQPSHVE